MQLSEFIPVARALKAILPSKFTKTVTQLDNQIKSTVGDTVFKTISPKKRGKETPSQRKKFTAQASLASEDIVANKNKINFVDEAGQTVSGRLPQTVDEWSEAIAQGKQNLFKEMETVLKRTDDTVGAQDMRSVVQGMLDVATDPDFLRRNPELSRYAADQARRYADEILVEGGTSLNPKQLTASQLQGDIAALNRDLNNFYLNQSREDAGRRYVDALLANQLRNKLDNMVELARGTNPEEIKRIADIKQKYGAYKAIEADVNNKAFQVAKKQGGGLISDFAEITSGQALLNAVIFSQPKLALTGIALGASNKIRKALRDPDRRVRRMFENVDVLHRRKQELRRPEVTTGGQGLLSVSPQRQRQTRPVGERALVPQQQAPQNIFGVGGP